MALGSFYVTRVALPGGVHSELVFKPNVKDRFVMVSIYVSADFKFPCSNAVVGVDAYTGSDVLRGGLTYQMG